MSYENTKIYESTKTVTKNYHRERRAKGYACALLCCERCGGKQQRHKLETTN